MEQYVLYLVLKSLIHSLDERYKTSFNDMSSIAEYSIGIFIRGGTTPNYRKLSTGGYYNHMARVQFLINSGKSKNDLMNTLSLVSKIRSIIPTLGNSIHRNIEGVTSVDGMLEYSDDGKPIELAIASTSLLGEPGTIGMTEQDLPVYSINFHFNYFIKEVI